MKKRIAVSLLAVMLMLAGCGKKTETEPSTTAPEQVPETQATEAVQETQQVQAAPVDADAVCEPLIGVYQDSVSQRAMMRTKQAEGGLAIEVIWASSASEASSWNMTAVLTQDNKLEYTDGVQSQITANENGELYTQEISSNQQGFFTIEDGKLLWDGAADESCRACVFELLPEEDWEPVYEGIYEHPYSEEIAGTLIERSDYIILNEDHTGCVIAQAVGMLTWDEHQLKQEVGEVNDFTLTQKDGKVILTVYAFQDENGDWVLREYEKIDELPADIAELFAEELAWRANH